MGVEEQKKKDSLSTKKKGSLGVIRRRDDLKFKKYAVLSLRNKLKVKTRMTSQFSDIFQDLGTDFFQQISGEAARLANGKRVSLKEVMAAVNLVGRQQVGRAMHCSWCGGHQTQRMPQRRQG